MPENNTVTVNYIYDAEGAGKYIGGVTAQTMRTWRRKGVGPPYVVVSKNVVRYRQVDLDRWLEQQTVRPGDQKNRSDPESSTPAQ
ncbi:hypothetical protein BVC93_24445 [Mycobacterium sp. MS1601]|uniref:helix-turn-helix transcriptional regulator n=1 Tax=Mycobacterium sp. MS1601 TaxID=1936029 RepID=UPI0009797B3F|nr:helix-turn-helix domain-containing protein [Mycobacterium sp. MS1601]AQA05031.1 hypothetical protein BVC93_24445 [Mycobacterium sp. MS1601]